MIDEIIQNRELFVCTRSECEENDIAFKIIILE